MKDPQSNPDVSTKCCPNCGMSREEWADQEGYAKGDETYCCEGCADESGCTCG